MIAIKPVPGPDAVAVADAANRRDARDRRVDAGSLPSALLRSLLSLPGRALLLLIRIYQRTLSPVLPIVTLGRCGCRFSPTCSHYAADAIRTHGAAAGIVLSAVRLLKCTPLHPGGFDPVPPKRSRPRCGRLAA